ncbi:hypothetical protein LBM2029_09045 [Ralstonia solanacearum]|nr:hypothetical protein LBM2029_09045 [Ralstonia solanacearum]
MNGVLQDRLVKELRLRGIRSMDAANAYAPTFIADFNARFAKVLYLLEDRPEHRRLVHRYLEVAEYPDGRIELWADGAALPCTTHDRFAEVDQGAIVEHKRLGHALAIAAQVQAQRDDRRQVGPSRTLAGEPPRQRKPSLNVKRQRLINLLDLERAIASTSPPS